ncbi:Cu-binding protein [Malassezia cuniculi]|uniref:Cu-binding protein n=1 Tax=Malassezia cuniculi TaxID=948313 RepID=A0AAF0EPQ0_9BASI|nr:Cu-binding protein [Malassezia cuniculi]
MLGHFVAKKATAVSPLLRRAAAPAAAPALAHAVPTAASAFRLPAARAFSDQAPKGVDERGAGTSAAGATGATGGSKQAPRPDPLASSMRQANITGPFSLTSAGLFVVTGIGLYFYFQYEKKQAAERRARALAAQDVSVGRPRIGGPFSLVSSTGHPFTDDDLLGSFSLIYFGFTNCPDICPEELDKMGTVVEAIAKDHGEVINPVFVTCDPARDRVPQVAEYIADFHPRMIGLTGTYESIKECCKAYRVYFSTPPGADPTKDYLVDHSIFFYLMDPEGKFVDAFGKGSTAEEVHAKTDDYVRRWKAARLPLREADAKERIANDGRAPASDKDLWAPPSAEPSRPVAVVASGERLI